jgi:rod shape-determining protein MreC
VALLDIRERAGYLFLVVTLGHIILISAQVNSKSGVPVLEQVTFGVFAEVQRSMTGVVSGVRHFWSGYVGLRDVREENAELKQQLADVQVQLQQQRALADRSRGLDRLLGLRERLTLDTMTIDKGSQQGLKSDMAIIAPAGVVGRVVVPSLRAAKVQLLIDRNAAAGALIERSRAQGVVVGAGDELLRLEYVSEIADVAVGDVVVTSGIDGIFPKGFVIGRVETVERSGRAYRRVTVSPAVDFSSLEEVLVVLTPTPARELVGEIGK